MVDQPHSEQPPERQAPGKWSSNILKVGSALCFAAGIGAVTIGAMAIGGKKAFNMNFSKLEGTGIAVGGAVATLTGIAGWKHANFAGVVREATHRDDLLIQEAAIRKELAGMNR